MYLPRLTFSMFSFHRLQHPAVCLCLAVLLSLICPKNYTVLSSVWGIKGIYCCLVDTKAAFTSNSRSPNRMPVFMRSIWGTTEAKIRASSTWQTQVKSNFQTDEKVEINGGSLGKEVLANLTLITAAAFVPPRIPDCNEWAVQGYWWVI